jgi:hypothetical protein
LAFIFLPENISNFYLARMHAGSRLTQRPVKLMPRVLSSGVKLTAALYPVPTLRMSRIITFRQNIPSMPSWFELEQLYFIYNFVIELFISLDDSLHVL